MSFHQNEVYQETIAELNEKNTVISCGQRGCPGHEYGKSPAVCYDDYNNQD